MIVFLGRLVGSFFVLVQLRFGHKIGARAADDLERARFDAGMDGADSRVLGVGVDGGLNLEAGQATD